MRRLFAILWLASVLAACTQGTYYDFGDTYTRGLRWFDRGNYEQARIDWELLAKAGDCDAEFRLGTLYFLGAGVPKDLEAARAHWVKASNQGHGGAQHFLAIMYAQEVTFLSTPIRKVRFDCSRGCGVTKNLIEASKWAALSMRFSVYEGARKSAGEMIVDYHRSMDSEQIAESERQIQNWSPYPVACKQRKLL